MIHSHQQRVHFGDCDPAGIVYFPRFFNFFHETMESWFGAQLGESYADVILGRKIGFPTVHTEADFRIPCRLGEMLSIEMRLGEIGRSSLALHYCVREHQEHQDENDREIRMEGHTVVVAFDMNPAHDGYMRSVEIPADLREKMELFKRS